MVARGGEEGRPAGVGVDELDSGFDHVKFVADEAIVLVAICVIVGEELRVSEGQQAVIVRRGREGGLTCKACTL